jgi:hypothetical protein
MHHFNVAGVICRRNGPGSISRAEASGISHGTVFYLGGYFELLYFLTGEHQKHDKREDVFGRVVRRSNLA